MKKIIGTLVLFICLSSIGYCQFTKGRFMAGGSLSATSSSYNYNDGSATSKSNSVSFYPQVGYFMINNFAAGVGLSLSRSHYKAPSASPTGDVSSNSINFSPFARYYIHKFFGQATFERGTSKTKTEGTSGSPYHLKNTGWSLSAGYAFLLNNHVAIEPQVGYGINYVDTSAGNNTTNGNLFLKAGIQVYIGR